MNLCNDGHDEICYEGRDCPLCDERTERRMEVEELEKQIKELQEAPQDE